MRTLFCVLVMFLLVSQQILAQKAAAQTPSARDGKFSGWMTYYYLNKNTSEVPDWLQWLQDSQIVDKNEGATSPFSAFISVLFSDNPNSVEPWVKGTVFTGKTAGAIEMALWLSGREDLIGKVFKETPEYTEHKPIQLINLTLKHPSDFDAMWGAFAASGNPQYVKKVIDVLDESVALTGDKTLDKIYRASAEWSLASNMLQHELVNRLILKEVNLRTGVVKEKLEGMIARNKQKRKPFPDQDGDFTAMLVVAHDNDLKEFDKPSDQVVHLSEVSKAKRGDVVAIKIVFASMELTEDLMADVVFDLKVLNPDGTVYGSADYKNLAALQTKVPTRFSVFDNKTVIKIHFEPNDKLGKYKVVATIRDNVGRKTISMTKEVKLVQ